MWDKSVGFIIIINDDKYVVGIIIDRDLCNKVVSGLYFLFVFVDFIMLKFVIIVKLEVIIVEV